MQLGVVSWVWQQEPLSTAVREAHRLGLRYMEVGSGGFFNRAHCDPLALIEDDKRLDSFRKLFDEHELTISAIAMHGEPLHPDPLISEPYDRELRAAIDLAAKLHVDCLTLLSGLPAAHPGDVVPNWLLYPFPSRNLDAMTWQWEERLIPYWRERAKIASDAGVRLAFEMTPADMCHQPSRLMAMRSEIGPAVGANLDPSHLTWQGMDIPSVIHYLGDAIYNVHAKESQVNDRVARIDGVLEMRRWDRDQDRAWNFRTAGFSKSLTWWREVISALRAVGYDGVLAYEHEDPMLDAVEGLEKGIEFLAGSILKKPRSPLWYSET
jgi:sugar phosphate isomerase/epimerase